VDLVVALAAAILPEEVDLIDAMTDVMIDGTTEVVGMTAEVVMIDEMMIDEETVTRVETDLTKDKHDFIQNKSQNPQPKLRRVC
jgi:hypothetical protein